MRRREFLKIACAAAAVPFTSAFASSREVEKAEVPMTATEVNWHLEEAGRAMARAIDQDIFEALQLDLAVFGQAVVRVSV